jgi:hypothetical protein
MRVRTILLASFWVALFLWVGYNGMQAIYSYFQTNDLTEQAFTGAWERQRQRSATDLYSAEFLTDLRSSLLMSARRAGIQVDPASIKVSAEGGLVRVGLSWTYRTEPRSTWGFDTGLPLPLWLGRSFDPQLGPRRMF